MSELAKVFTQEENPHPETLCLFPCLEVCARRPLIFERNGWRKLKTNFGYSVVKQRKSGNFPVSRKRTSKVAAPKTSWSFFEKLLNLFDVSGAET